MLNLNQIKAFYKKSPLKVDDRNLLREYLQYLILDKVFSSPLASKLNFIGGTCLRICYGNDRFSEDLDFDSFDMSWQDFSKLTVFVCKRLENEGLSLETKNVYKGSFRCYLRILNLLYEFGLSPLKGEKILIQLDSTRQDFAIKPDFKIINKFGVFKEIKANPVDILLSQKISAFLNRKTIKGRDIYDIVYLFSLTTPNFDYLKSKNDLKDIKHLKRALENRLKKANLKLLTRDVEHFLIKKEKLEVITKFPKFIENL